MRVPPPGPRSLGLARRLERVESRNVTHLADDFPVFWEEARGSNIVDVDGNVYVDLTAGFAVAAAGHAHPRIVAAVREQAGRLLHGMGDVHPSEVKVRSPGALSQGCTRHGLRTHRSSPVAGPRRWRSRSRPRYSLPEGPA
jgi:4-aminobutyrate aminotransferase-like enzyme